MNALIVFLTGVAIYILFWLGRIFMQRAGKLKGERASMVFTTVELVLWMLYFFWTVDRLFERKSYYDYLFVGLVFIFVILLAWFYVKDLVAGSLFKIQHNPKPGRFLQAENIEGVIRKAGATHLTLETPDGELIKIPFSKLQGSVITQGYPKEHAGDFRLHLRLEKSIPKEEAIARIRASVLHDPYCVFKKPVEVKPLEEDEETCTYEVTVTAISAQFLSGMENRIERHLQQTV